MRLSKHSPLVAVAMSVTSSLALSLTLSLTLQICSTPCAMAQAVTSAEVQTAFNLYKQQRYAEAATSFENLIRRQPTASYCYYAALAHQASHKTLRAQQLFQYIVTTFPNSQEAAYAKSALGPNAGTASSATAGKGGEDKSDELPESVKALMPKDMLAMLDTPQGKEAVKQMMKDKASEMATIRAAEKKGVLDPKKVAARAQAEGVPISRAGSEKQFPFTAQDIAKDGAAAIDQMSHPNCWFEASLAAMAELPRGQRLIASMIRGKGNDTYVVRFPGDGKEYQITTLDLQEAGIHDSALWASLIECAQLRKFPNNEGSTGADDDLSRLQVGLTAVSGYKAEVLDWWGQSAPAKAELSSFIDSAVRSKNPIVCATYPGFGKAPMILFPRHAYTIIGYDPASHMVILRNPHGKHSRSFSLPSDPKHRIFEQLDDGVCKVSIDVFPSYFYIVSRSFI